MDEWFRKISADSDLQSDIEAELSENGFSILPGRVAPVELSCLAAAYDAAVLTADAADRNTGSTTTRVQGLVNRGPDFDELYLLGPILAACCTVIARPFKLGSMLARTLNPNSPEQGLHVDFESEPAGWPMLGFIIMIDEFREENGATRFIPGSHAWTQTPPDLIQEKTVHYVGEVPVCGPGGSIVVYNGSVWHGHGANLTDRRRRSIQGAYVRRDAKSWIDQPGSVKSETLGRIGPLAKYLLAIQHYL